SRMINNLKLKASYGFVGDQAGVGFYPGYDVYNIDNLGGAIATSFHRSGYPNLTWEKSKMFQTGVEFTLFNRRLEGSVDFYSKLTEQLIFDSRISPSIGDAIMKVNDGKLLNQGIEFNLVGHLVRTENFFLDLSVNGEMMRNRIIEMPFDNTTQKRKVLDASEVGYGRTQGSSIYDFYMREWAGVDPNTGAARWWMNYEDKVDPITGQRNGKYDEGEEILSLTQFLAENPNAVISETITEDYSKATQKFVGKSIIPDVRGAINLNLGYKGFSIGAQMLYSIGGYVYDASYADLMGNLKVGENNWHTNIRNRWQKPGDITNVPRYTSNRVSENDPGDALYAGRSTRFLTRADYFLLNNVNIGYTLSKDVLNGTGLQEVKLTLSADNLWLRSARKGLNPISSETGESSSYRYAPVSNFTFGLRVKF
ncbi:MAG: SusC/RagA family TonB-linked outer membrane protein, partial [Flavobacteriaceae bacterium]|nr:SusC/RagA family TonB-linked outer membrane protein [Flavobacteriaceae bacterium]